MSTATDTQTTYVSVTDTAKLIRAALKRAHPTTKFSVRSDKYAGGASIRIYWTDGPTEAQVQRLTSSYEGGRFDGMIDMAYNVSHFLHDDGIVTLAHDPGSEGSRGLNPERFGDPKDGSGRVVHFLADYVFENRTNSDELVDRCARMVEPNGTFGDARSDRCDGCGNWPGVDAACWVARYTERDTERVSFVCSKLCGGRLIARHTEERAQA